MLQLITARVISVIKSKLNKRMVPSVIDSYSGIILFFIKGGDKMTESDTIYSHSKSKNN